MEASPFARLSAELRNQIWTYALCQPDGFYLDHLQYGDYELLEKDHQIALIKTCRQINAEASLLLYNVNKFTFRASTIGFAGLFLPLVKDWILAALSATFDLDAALDEGEYVRTLTLELPLIDESEAIRRVEEVFEAEKNGVMQRLELDDEESDLDDPEVFQAWALEATDDDCAELDKWKDALLCAIKEA
ncbi:hypothetical protein KC316_g13343 [Hortaea werneckii]|nr:hypothetical protein KC334_g6289 [Hortaea werneckii]KAI7169709.1 hypothetical protein KC324_g11276 [Hortaea werneckii]KAI7558150.1 hypothetical protein KC316_g13343 [Hortaea werneckii]